MFPVELRGFRRVPWVTLAVHISYCILQVANVLKYTTHYRVLNYTVSKKRRHYTLVHIFAKCSNKTVHRHTGHARQSSCCQLEEDIAGLQRSDHITDTLASFHWLKVPERIQFKQATIVYRSLNGTAPRYLAADLRRLSDMPSRRRLRSPLTDQLYVRQSQCSTVGDWAFAVAGARLWNSLPVPHDIVASDTLSHFRRGLKTFLFRQSYPSILF